MNSLTPEVQIRHMTPADLDRVIEIERSLKQAPHWPRLAWLSALDPLSSPQRIALVAEDLSTEKVAGFAVASLLPPQAELELIAVASEAQRRGVAGFLFAPLAKELRTRLVTEVCLEVRASNQPALALYRHLGFAETARRTGYYADPVEDAVLLSLRLP
jgi:[ribosomal protein S18]-alanine N-acetyltransferase